VRKERLELSRLTALEPKSSILHSLNPCYIMVSNDLLDIYLENYGKYLLTKVKTIQ